MVKVDFLAFAFLLTISASGACLQSHALESLSPDAQLARLDLAERGKSQGAKAVVDTFAGQKYSRDFYLKAARILDRRELHLPALVIAVCTQAIKQYPDYAEMYVMRGATWVDVDENESGEKDLLTAIKYDANNAYCYAKLAVSHKNRIKFDYALKCIDKAISLDKTKPLYFDIKGQICKAMHKTDLCIASFKEAIRLTAPGARWRVRGHLGHFLEQSKLYQQAIDVYRDQLVDAKNKKGVTLEIESRIGFCYVELKQYKQALPWLDKAVEHGNNMDARKDRAKCYTALGKHDLAEIDNKYAEELEERYSP